MLRLYEIVRYSAFRVIEMGDVAFVVEYHSDNMWLRNPQTNVLVRSVADRSRFMANHIFAYGFGRSFVDYFEGMIRRFDADFFENKMLIIRYFETGSGMSSIYVDGVFIDAGNVLRVDVSVYIPYGYVPPNRGSIADRGNNFLIISLPRIENIYPIADWNFIIK